MRSYNFEGPNHSGHALVSDRFKFEIDEIEFTGEYPPKDEDGDRVWSINERSDLYVDIVKKGVGKLGLRGVGIYDLKEGETPKIFIPAGLPYFYDGEMTVQTWFEPPFVPEQYILKPELEIIGEDDG